jgi:type VI protein secretion system component VasF
MLRNRELVKAEQKLKVKESLAKQAKSRGMESTYNNYIEDIAELKSFIKRLRQQTA